MAKPLIVYFSKTGHSKQLASLAQTLVGGDLCELNLVARYPENYILSVMRSGASLIAGELPKLRQIPDISAYREILLCYPLWWWELPTPVMRFLHDVDTTGKTIYPICSCGGGGLGKSVKRIRKLAPYAAVQKGIFIREADTNNKTAAESLAAYLAPLGK